MFTPHTVSIRIPRAEPKNLDLSLVVLQVERAQERLAREALLGNVFSSDGKGKAKAIKKIEIEKGFELELKEIQGFLKLWNEWRFFYFNISNPIKIEKRVQLTKAQNALKFFDENKLFLNIAIGCVFKLWKTRKYKRLPNFDACYTLPVEIYDDFWTDVEGDLEKRIYQESVLG